MKFKTLLTVIFIFCFVGCLSDLDPGEEIINVTKTSGGNARSSWTYSEKPTTYTPVVTENFSVKVSELKWFKFKGVWVGNGGLKPADKEAVEAIEAYMKK